MELDRAVVVMALWTERSLYNMLAVLRQIEEPHCGVRQKPSRDGGQVGGHRRYRIYHASNHVFVQLTCVMMRMTYVKGHHSVWFSSQKKSDVC